VPKKIDLDEFVKVIMISRKKFSELNEIISKQSEPESKRVVFAEEDE
jgi:hypothetical protein